MSAEQREALEAGLRQVAFRPESDISEQRRLLRRRQRGNQVVGRHNPGCDRTIDPDAAVDVIVLDRSADKARHGAGRPGLCVSSFTSSEAPRPISCNRTTGTPTATTQSGVRSCRAYAGPRPAPAPRGPARTAAPPRPGGAACPPRPNHRSPPVPAR